MINGYKNAMDKVYPSNNFEEKIKSGIRERRKAQKDRGVGRMRSLIAVAAAACVIGVIIMCGFPLLSGRDGSVLEGTKNITTKGDMHESIASYVVRSSDYPSTAASYKSSVGECIVSEEVQNALEDNDNGALFFVSIFLSDKNGPVDAELVKSEAERLKEAGYNVFFAKGELSGLLTKDQILDFSIDNKYAYLIEWVRDENGIVNWKQ